MTLSSQTLPAMGTVGRAHLLSAAQAAFQCAEQGIDPRVVSGDITLGARLLCLAWGEFLPDGALAAQIVRLAPSVPAIGEMLPADGLRLAARVAAADTGGNLPEAERLFVQGNYRGMARAFEQAAAQGSLFPALRQAMHFQSVLSDWEWLESFIRRVVVPVMPDLAEPLLAEVLLASGRYGEAAVLLERVAVRCGPDVWGLKLAAALAGAGRADRAQDVLGRLLARFPEHVSALLFMDRLAFAPAIAPRPEGRCEVAVYSYNKCAELTRTLDSVLASDLGCGTDGVTVRVLVNGSRDASLDAVNAARDRFGPALKVESLPINVGAPAARNWLLDCALKSGAKWIAYLDDDVLVPTDWLSRLLSGTVEFPDAGVWGCRVADVRSPDLTQHGDGFLLDPELAARVGERVSLREPCTECMVAPLLAGRRYAASVTGCCHLFDTASLAESGGFDLLFSPSQLDDLDLDLRRLATGRPAAYLGDLTITHLRESTHFLKLSPQAQAQSALHRHLLEERHAPRLAELLEIQKEVVERDLASRRARLQEAGLLPARP